MSRRVSTAPGKAFLWLIAVAVACLMEGALLQSSAWASFYQPPTASTTVSVQAEEVQPSERTLYRAAAIVVTVVRYAGSVR